MLASKNDSFEQRRIMWTSYNNLHMWFDNRFKALWDLGRVERDNDDTLCIPKDQLSCMLNIDKPA